MIRTISENDCAAVWQVEQQAHRFHWTEAQILYQLKGQRLNFGLWQDDQLVAFILLQNIFPEVELLNIAVVPAQHNKKLGRTLLRYTLNHLIAQKYKRLYLEVRASNHAAIHLYELLGFNQIGERKQYYPAENKRREDALLYGKELCY